MSALSYPEAGYTPDNLQAWMDHWRLDVRGLAALLTARGPKKVAWRTVASWLRHAENGNHRDMPLKAWLFLQAITEQQIEEMFED